MTDTCLNCGGLIMEPGKAYGWAGKTCQCPVHPSRLYQNPASNPLLPEYRRLTKWCTYCRKDDHNDSECWCTRSVPPGSLSPIVSLADLIRRG